VAAPAGVRAARVVPAGERRAGERDRLGLAWATAASWWLVVSSQLVAVTYAWVYLVGMLVQDHDRGHGPGAMLVHALLVLALLPLAMLLEAAAIV
jgi:hypothetical protein